MALTFHPKPGLILFCDFSEGFKEPEIVKTRPVIVLAPPLQGRSNLVTVVALSTVKPAPERNYHYQVPKAAMPQVGYFQGKDSWVKGDMVYSVGFHRLDLIKLGKRDANTGKRVYYRKLLDYSHMKIIRVCVLHGMGLGYLSEHLAP